jgi:hypothetical protein
MVSRTSILIGENAEACARDLLTNHLIANWQRLAPGHVDAARILIVAFGDDEAYESSLDQVIEFATARRTIWRHDDYLTYGDPRGESWIPPMS